MKTTRDNRRVKLRSRGYFAFQPSHNGISVMHVIGTSLYRDWPKFKLTTTLPSRACVQWMKYMLKVLTRRLQTRWPTHLKCYLDTMRVVVSL